MKRPLSWLGTGALLAWFFDPTLGRRRRALARDRARGLVNRRIREAARLRRRVGAAAYGGRRKATHPREAPRGPIDDATLKAKVESEIFRPADVPKGQIAVNAENGVVVLRGEVPHPALVRALEAQVRRIAGVRGVENLLHLPGTEAPTYAAHGRER